MISVARATIVGLLAATFAFSARELPVKDWIQSERITKNASEMLINALQGRDEFAELKQRFGESGATLRRHKANLSWPAGAPPESKAVAEQIWELAAKGPVTVLELPCQFIPHHDNADHLLSQFGLDPAGIATAARAPASA